MNSKANRLRSIPLALVGAWLIAAGLVTLLVQESVPQELRRLRQPARAAKAQAADDAADAMQDAAEKSFPGGAALKTDPEQQRLLKRAEQCIADGRLDLAAVLWQKVLDEAGDTLMTRDGRTYTSLAEEVERTLSRLDPAALRIYRIQADGEAQALLAAAAPDKEEDALSQVVRRYFLSSIGDDAAFKLACYALDRHDFVGASRLLTRILDRHPDPSMPKSEILLRLAVASAHVGDASTARAAMDAIPQIPGPRPESEVLDLVQEDLAAASAQASSLASTSSRNWLMALGNSSRTGRMPVLPSQATSRTLSELWVLEQPMAIAPSNAMNPYGVTHMGFVMGRSGRMPVNTNRQQAVSRDDLVEQWREHKWRPSPMLLFDEGRVFVKTHENLLSYSASANSDRPIWKTAWLNRFELDAMSVQTEMMMRSYGANFQLNNDKPRGLAEVFLFGDRVHQQMSISGGMIYTIEGERTTGEPGAPNRPREMRPFQWGVQARRTRSNFLAAYEARTGKAKWHRAASDDDKEGSQDVGFLCAPAPMGNLLLTAITDGGTIWLTALNAADGNTVWKSYLCDEPVSGCNPWSPVGIAVEGRDAYVACGAGVVFAVDAVSGSMRWAVRYQRSDKGSRQPMQQWYGYQNLQREVSGWDDDVVIPAGRTLIVMASDSDQILALDRRSGSLLWPKGLPRTPAGYQEANYCVGVSGRGLIVAGSNVVRRWDIPSGKLIWDRELGESFGRGCLTDDAVYIPVKDSIVKLDAATGKELIQVGVALTTNDPVGNLFSDGEKLWVTGGGRVYAMTNLEHRLAMLSEQVATGDGEAQLNRMRLYAKSGQKDLMLADLRGSYELFKRTLTAEEAAQKFLAAISELKLPQEDPPLALELIVEQFATASSPAELGKAIPQRDDLLAVTLATIRRQKLAGQSARILAAAPLLDKEHLQNLASQALAAAAGEDDLAAMEKALSGSDLAAPMIAAVPLSKLSPERAKEPLAKLVKSEHEGVKLAAARGLANLSDRAALPIFVTLLEAKDGRVRARSHQALRAISPQPITFAAEGPEEERAKTVARWKEWLDKEGAEVAWKVPLPEGAIPLGRTLIASQGQQSVIELDESHKKLWETKLNYPWGCQGLANGHRLVSVLGKMEVVEFNDRGVQIWAKSGLPAQPYSVQRLENGNTLIACPDAQQVLEVDDGGKTVSTFPFPGDRPICARRLESGRTLVCLQLSGKVVEVEKPNARPVWAVEGLSSPISASRLEDGNTLIVQMGVGERQVIEVGPTGKRSSDDWAVTVQLQNPTDAVRLPNGNTLVSDQRGLYEIQPNGRDVHRQLAIPNISSISHF